jgi:hypothetical protein
MSRCGVSVSLIILGLLFFVAVKTTTIIGRLTRDHLRLSFGLEAGTFGSRESRMVPAVG